MARIASGEARRLRMVGGDTGGPHQREHHGGRDIAADGTGPLGRVDELAHRLFEVPLRRGHRQLDLDAGAEQGLDQVPLGGALLDQVGQEGEEGGPGVVGLDPGAGIVGDAVDTADEDGLEQLLLGREVAVQRAHPHPGLLGDEVDRDRDALGGEHRLRRLEEPGPVALGVRPERARLVPTQVVCAWAHQLRASVAWKSSSPIDKRSLRSV